MRRWRTLWILLVLTTPLHAGIAEEAQAAWNNRDQPGQTERAVALWEEALKQEPKRSEFYIFLTRASGRAFRHAIAPKDRQHWADLARRYGMKAIETNAQNSDAYAEYGAALGQWAQAHKGIHSLSVVRQAIEALKKAVALNPKNAYAHMLLASFYREAPGFISVGDKRKALEHAKLAVEHGPGYAINHLVLARVYLDLGKKPEATHELRTIAALTPPADAVPETRSDQETALELLREKHL